jgi:hypothetical protein
MPRVFGRILLLGMAMGLLLPAASPASFCSSPILRDYEITLRAFPPSNPLPQHLPFGPPNLEASPAWRVGPHLLRIEGSPAYWLKIKGPDDRLDLNWTVKLRVSRPASDGSPGELVLEADTKVEAVMAGDSAQLVAGELEKRGFYRIDISFQSQDGNLLGSYFEYVRVVPARLDVRVGFKRRTVSPGASTKFRLENLGTHMIRYGAHYSLDRFEDGDWRRISQGKKFVPSVDFVEAGRAGGCQVVHIPRSAEPGLYRIRKRLRTAGTMDLATYITYGTFHVKARPSANNP